MAKKRKSAFDSKIPRKKPVGWSRNWEKLNSLELSVVAEGDIDSLTPEDRLYLLYESPRCMTAVFNKYWQALVASDRNNSPLIYDELCKPTLQKRFLEEWLGFEESEQPASENIAILVNIMIICDHLSPKLIQEMFQRKKIDDLIELDLNDDECFLEEHIEKLLACYKHIQLDDYERLLMRERIGKQGKEFLLKKRSELEKTQLENRVAETIEKPTPKFDAL